MNDTKKHPPHLAPNESTHDTLMEMAQDMNVALYRRYGEAAAAKLLGFSVDQLNDLRTHGKIGFLDLSDNQVSFFGYQLLTYLLGCIVPPDSKPREKPVPAPSTSKSAATVDAELISVDDAIAQLAIGKTKFYDLLKSEEIACVKIGRRTLIERTEIRRYIDKQIG